MLYSYFSSLFFAKVYTKTRIRDPFIVDLKPILPRALLFHDINPKILAVFYTTQGSLSLKLMIRITPYLSLTFLVFSLYIAVANLSKKEEKYGIVGHSPLRQVDM